MTSKYGQRPIECLILIGHFSQKGPIISGSFAKNDLQMKKASYGSLPFANKFGECRKSIDRGGPIAHTKSHVIFRQRATNYRALLRKMTSKDKASYGSFANDTAECRESIDRGHPIAHCNTLQHICNTLQHVHAALKMWGAGGWKM